METPEELLAHWWTEESGIEDLDARETVLSIFSDVGLNLLQDTILDELLEPVESLTPLNLDHDDFGEYYFDGHTLKLYPNRNNDW